MEFERFITCTYYCSQFAIQRITCIADFGNASSKGKTFSELLFRKYNLKITFFGKYNYNVACRETKS